MLKPEISLLRQVCILVLTGIVYLIGNGSSVLGQQCVRRTPTIVVKQNGPAVSPGNIITFAVTVTNNDSPGCGASTFLVMANFPAPGFQHIPDCIRFTLAPRESATRTIAIKSPPDICGGSKVFQETVTNESDPAFSSSVDVGFSNSPMIPGCDLLTIKITEPAGEVILSAPGLHRLTGRIQVPAGLSMANLSSVTLEVKSLSDTLSYSIALTDYLLRDSADPNNFIFSVNNLSLFQGANEIAVRAKGELSVPPIGPLTVTGGGSTKVVFGPPIPNLNIYVLGMEVTQAVQGDEVWNGVTGSDPPVKRSNVPQSAIAYQSPALRVGVPLVAHKTTAVRVYGAIENSPQVQTVYDVPARLIGRVDGVALPGSPLLAYAPIDPIDDVTKADGSLDLAQTLENKRARLSGGWYFVLPDSWTLDTGAGGKALELEVQLNPPDELGPQECNGCNDEANKLIISEVKFTKTASLAIRSFYVLGDGNEMDAHRKTFCGGFLNMYPVRDGCGTGPINSNDPNFGINLLSLTPRVKTDSSGNIDLARGMWQDQMCKKMLADYLHTLPLFTTPAAYVALGPIGLGGAVGNNIIPSACAATDFPGLSEEDRYSIAAQEIGHGDFTSRKFDAVWHACGNTPPGGFPRYKNAIGHEYYPGSIGQFGINTSKKTILFPTRMSDFMGYTYCDRNTAEKLADDTFLIRANSDIKISESASSLGSSSILAGGTISARGLTFTVTKRTPKTSVRLEETTIQITGAARDGDLFIKVGGRPNLKLRLGGGQGIDSIVDSITSELNDQAGVDLLDRQIFSAFSWVSPFTFNLMFSEFKSAATPSAPIDIHSADTIPTRQTGSREYLVASGQIGPSSQTSPFPSVILDPFYRVVLPAGTADEAGTGAFDLELQNQNMQPLFVRHFNPGLPHPDLPQVTHFNQTLPFLPDTARIVIRRGNNVLAVRSLSPNPPTVTVLSPNGGEAWGPTGEQAIQWVATDGDGDRLSYSVYYSRDAGQSWELLATGLTETRLVVNTAFLPGSSLALIRILATDGVNTAEDRSDRPFTVAKKKPAIWITGFEEGAVVELDSVINLQANMISPDEEVLNGDDFVWISDRIGLLGTGARLQLSTNRLAPGVNRISLLVFTKQAQPVSADLDLLRTPTLVEVYPPLQIKTPSR